MKTKLFSLVLIFTLILSTLRAQQWDPLGPDDLNVETYGEDKYTDIVLDASGTPYIVFKDATTNNEVSVKKWNGNSWEYLLRGGISNYDAHSTNIALDATGTPYVVFIESSRGIVKKWNGSYWTNLGIFSTQAAYTNIALDAFGTPYVVYRDGYYESKATVKKWDGTSWDNLGIPGFSDGIVSFTNIAIDVSGTPYVVYRDGNYEGKATVKRWNGTSWEFLGIPGFSDGSVSFTNIAIDVSGKPYVVYSDASDWGKVTVKRWNETSWEDVGLTGISAGQADYTNIAIDPSGIPHIVYSDDGNANKVIAKKWNGRHWEGLGNPGFSVGQADYTNIVINASGTPYVVYRDWGNEMKATVKKWNSRYWEDVGSPGFSNGRADYTNIAIDASGTIYVVYQDGGWGGKATVNKWNGSSWEYLGNQGVSVGNADYTDIVVDALGIPYVVYRDMENGGGATVKKWNGSTWADLGSPGFSVGQADYTNITIDASGTPYVVYSDWVNERKVTVKKWNGSFWADMGSPGFSAGQADFTNISIDASGFPYVVYSDWGNGRKTTVKKWDGSSWIDLGSPGFSYGISYNNNIVFDNFESPFIVYKDGGIGKANVKKWNGNSWVDLGITGLSAGSGSFTSGAFDDNDNLIVVYCSTNAFAKIFATNVISPFIHIPDPNFEQALIDLGIDSDGIINHRILKTDPVGVTYLDVSDPVNNENLPNTTGKIADLTGIEAFTELTTLICSKNQLTGLNVSQNLLLTDLRCDNNELSVLDVSANTELTLLWCFQNYITELDVTKNTALIYLTCHRNQLTSLDVSQNLVLYSLSCGNNFIDEINITLNPEIQYLAVNDLALFNLDVSNNLKLRTLVCYNNKLNNLVLTQNIALIDLVCSNNSIAELDLIANTALVGLQCSNNPLSFMDLRNGNNINLHLTSLNTYLSCINVDDELADHSSWNVDVGVIFSNDCGYNTQRGELVEVKIGQMLEEALVEYVKVDRSGETGLEVRTEDIVVSDGYQTLEPSKVYDITTTAMYSGEIIIELDYSGYVVENEEALRMLHYEDEVWIDITTSVDTEDNILTGVTNSLSPFVIVEDIQPPVIECTNDISVTNDPGMLSAIVSFEPPTATDNSGSVVVDQIDDTGLSSGSQFPVGVSTLIYQATDGAGLTSACSFNVTVENPAPFIEQINAPVDPIPLGQPVNVKVMFSDNNLSTAQLDWGEENEKIWIDGLISGNNIIWDKLYLTTGVYPVTIRLTDLGGEVTEEVYRYIVIYDPTAGFVTGGGWIFSPEGAYTPDPLLIGKASFGFVSKYKKGSTVPDGNTEFQFKAGNLNFKSTAYEWLVIAGSKAIFKGNGTINGFGNYGFILSAIDADLTPSADIDKFGIKIWDKDNNDDVVVYDNNFEADETADPTTEIGGGSIIIHTSKTKSADIEPGLISKTENSNISVYPNPFDERLHFEFVSPDDVYARIDIFDITGRKVKTIFNDFVGGGVNYNTVFVPLSEVSSTYLYRVTLGESVFYGKVIYKKR